MSRLRVVKELSKNALMILNNQKLSEIVSEDLENAVFTLTHMIMYTRFESKDDPHLKALERIRDRVKGELAERELFGGKNES